MRSAEKKGKRMRNKILICLLFLSFLLMAPETVRASAAAGEEAAGTSEAVTEQEAVRASTETSYTISYVLSDGAKNSEKNPSEYDGSKTIKLSDPTRKGYTFEGWYTTSKYEKKVTQIKQGSSGDQPFYAKWKANKYKVKYVKNHNSATGKMSDSSHTYNKAKDLTANAFMLTGYTFKEWNTKSDGSGTVYKNKTSVQNLSSVDGKTIKLYAVWVKNSYTVKFNGNGSTGGSMSNQKFSYNKAKNLTMNGFTRKGYTFSSWNTKADGSGTSYQDSQSVKNKNLTLYASWKANTYTVKYMSNSSAAIGTMKDVTHIYDKAKKLSNNGFMRTGYTFKCWNMKADGSGKSYTNIESVKNLTSSNGKTVKLYAIWTENTYTIKFNGNGSTSGSMANLSVKYTQTTALTNNAYKRTDYTFVGWNTKKDGKGTTYKNKASIKNLTTENNGTVTLYAQWQKYPAITKYKKPSPAFYQYGGGDCAIASVAVLRTMKGNGKTASQNYEEVWEINGRQAYIRSWTALGLTTYNLDLQKDLSNGLKVIYEKLKNGPVICHRKNSTGDTHFSVIYAYTGNPDKLEKSGFQVYEVIANSNKSGVTDNLEKWDNYNNQGNLVKIVY